MISISNNIKRGFSRLSIKQKMMAITMAVSLFSIAVVGASILVTEIENLKKIQKINLQIMSEIIAETVSGYLLFGDEVGASAALGAMEAKKQITKAILYKRNKSMFAIYLRDAANGEATYESIKNVDLLKGGFNALKSVELDNETIGYLYLESDDSLVNGFIEKTIVSFIVTLSLVVLVLYALTSRLQRFVSDPIEHLTDTASKITAGEDYSLRAEKESADEIGVLTDEFNNMLARIQSRNRELLESEKKFREVVEQSVDALFIFDFTGRFVDVNNAACSALGYTRDEMLSFNLMDVDEHIRKKQDFLSLIHRLNERDVLDFDSEYVRKNGEKFPVDIRLAFVNIKEEKLVLGSARDITERKQIQNSLQQSKEMLEIKVNERTRELKEANRELSISKEKAEAASRAKSLFLANMSHEIRTPMNAVIGFTDVLATSGLNEQQIGYVKSIQSGGRNLLSLINDILDISKIEAGKMKFEFEKVYVRQLLEDVKQVYMVSAREKGLDLTLLIKASVPEAILTDELRLRQILFNLINNAIKYTREGSVKIIADYDVFSERAVYSSLKVSIIDTGVGIPSSDQKKIFNIFEQQDNQSTREFGGTGLGLAISLRLAERLNASISVDSELGRGSRFELIIKEPEVVTGSVQAVKQQQYTSISFKPAKVLIVDDVSANRELISEYLSDQPFEILHAENGKQALDVVAEDKNIDLVLMDVRMPIMGGVEATRIIKHEPKNKKLPVVAVTASVIEDKSGHRKRSLFDAVLHKPLNRKKLIKCLSGLLAVESEAELIEESDDSLSKFKTEMESADQAFYKEMLVFVPMLERAKNRGSFGGLDELLDNVCKLAVAHNMQELNRLIGELRVANRRFDIGETQKILTNIMSEINQKQGAVYE